MMLSSALLNHAYGAYLVLLQHEFGWSKTSLSVAFSLGRFESGLLGPVEGWLVDRFGPRAVMRVGLVIFASGFILFSRVDSLPAFYLAFLIMALGSSLAGFLPATVAVVNWFNRRRATATAVMLTGFAAGGLVVPIVVLCLETFGWRNTALGCALLVVGAGLPLTQMIRHRPEDYGMEVDGGPGATTAEAEDGEPDVDFEPREALRTSAFWLVSLGHGSALLVVGAVVVHLVSHLHDNLDYSLGTAAFVVSLMTGMQLVGQLTGGFLGDRFNKRLIAAGCMGGHMVALLLLANATALPMVIVFAVLHGLSWGIRGPLMTTIRADYFGRSSFGVIMGIGTGMAAMGNTAGPLVAGFLADYTGSYQTGFTILAILAGLGSIFFLTATKPKAPIRTKTPTEVLTALQG